MKRFLGLLLAQAALATGLTALGMACSSEGTLVQGPAEDAGVRRDVGAVDPPEGGFVDASNDAGPTPSCTKYCLLVTEACAAENAQYVSDKDCLSFCERLPVGEPGDKSGNTLACRQHFAGTPAHALPGTYCLAAGPFGGGVCGTRCTAFCQVALATCKAGVALAPYDSYPTCADACTGFAFWDGGTDGGGENPSGPESGDTLNCRMHWLRNATVDPDACPNIGPDSGACR